MVRRRTTLKDLFVVARNRSGRPTLQHRLVDGTATKTACGRDVSEWSRAYSHEPVAVILCRQPSCRNY